MNTVHIVASEVHLGADIAQGIHKGYGTRGIIGLAVSNNFH